VEGDRGVAPVTDDLAEVEGALTVTDGPPEPPTETEDDPPPDGDAFAETVGLLPTVVVAFTVAVGALTVTGGTVTVGALTGTVGALTGGGALRGTETVGVFTGTGGVSTVTVGVVTGTETVSGGTLSAAVGDAPASDPAASTPQRAILTFGAFDMRAIPNSERPSDGCGSTFVQ